MTTTNKMTTLEVRETRGKAAGRLGFGQADVVKNQSIRLYGTRWFGTADEESYDLTFKVGDMAVYGSYNLTYLGKIIAISDKQVTIEERHGTLVGLNDRVTLHRLSLFDFESRNWNFNLESIQRRNAEISMHI